MGTVYLLSDLHLGHKAICKYRTQFSSAEEHDAHIKEQYHSVVTKRDTVFFLGDIAFTKEALEEVATWRAEQKILIVGNHCHTVGTELLTSTGWIPVEKVTLDDMVATVNLDNSELVFDKPIKVVVNDSSEIYKISGGWVEDCVSSGHNIVIDGRLSSVSDNIGIHSSDSFMTAAMASQDVKVDISDDMIRLVTWVVMDGTMVRSSENKTRVQFKLSKERKIAELEELLTRMEIPYTKKLCKKQGCNKMQPYYIRIYGKYSLNLHNLIGEVKVLPKSWSNLNRKQTLVLLDTLQNTDGYREVEKIRWSTTSKHDVDVVQTACVVNGISFYFKEKVNTNGFANAKLQYVCNICDGMNVKSSKNVVVENSHEVSKTYGVTMRYGTVVSRRNGRVWVTGNCLDKLHMKDLVNVYDKIYSLYKYKEFWLSHCPIHPEELRGKKNIHGHTHYHNIDDSRYFNVSMENIEYKPVNIDEIRKHINKG